MYENVELIRFFEWQQNLLMRQHVENFVIVGCNFCISKNYFISSCKIKLETILKLFCKVVVCEIWGICRGYVYLEVPSSLTSSHCVLNLCGYLQFLYFWFVCAPCNANKGQLLYTFQVIKPEVNCLFKVSK